MATQVSQRIGIWIIAVVLTAGTLGSFLVMALSVQNESIDTAAQMKEYQEQQKQAAQLNADNSEALDGYSARKFDAAKATKLKVEVIKQGTGDKIKSTDSINSSYFGWLSDGTIFDSSNKKDSEDSPITFSLGGVITGWTEGLTGVKVGSVVRLTIPADKGYGASGSGIIPANAPMEFIVEIHKIDNSSTSS
jgi:FKBP-type peptidyl-prolyl cis-trans isomerase